MTSNRIKEIANMVTHGHRVTDVGCDHGFTCIYLIKEKISPYVIGMDINKGPLKSAKNNAKLLSKSIDLRLSDGISKLKEKEVDTILISGMGGSLIIKILEDGKRLLKDIKEIVISPQSNIDKVREYLTESGFIITDEKMIIEDSKYYNIIKAHNKDLYSLDIDSYTLRKKEEFYYGRILLEGKDKILYDFLTKRLKKLENLLYKLRKSSSENISLRIKEIEDDINIIKKSIKQYEGKKDE